MSRSTHDRRQRLNERDLPSDTVAWLTRLFWGLLAVSVFFLAALAVNQEPVALQFLTWRSPVISVFWWLLAAFLSACCSACWEWD